MVAICGYETSINLRNFQSQEGPATVKVARVKSFVSACWVVSEVTTDLQRSSPTICFSVKRNESNGVAQTKSVAMSVQSLRHFKTSQLIALYGRIRSQFVELSLLFRYWAKVIVTFCWKC